MNLEDSLDVSRSLHAAHNGKRRMKVQLTPASLHWCSDRALSDLSATAGAPRAYRRWKWVVAAGSVAALGVGLTSLALDGDGTCDGAGECARIYDGATFGWVSLVASAGLAGTAGWMFYRDRADERGPAIALTPTTASIAFAF